MEVVVSVFAVLVGLVCVWAIFRADKKDLDAEKSRQDES